MRALLSLLILALLLAVAPPALAQDEADQKPERPDDAAWVEVCPPDMMCAAGADGSAEDDKPTYDGDCGGEVCAYQGEPGTLGPDGCVDCMQPPKDQGSGCMDGEQAGETCRDDVQYMAPPAAGEAPAEQQADGQPKAAERASVPGASVGAALGILAVAAIALTLLTGRRRA